jgi:hypothetical protein
MTKDQIIERIDSLTRELSKLKQETLRLDCDESGLRLDGVGNDEVDPVLLAYTNMVETNRANRLASPKPSDSRMDADDCDDPVTNAYHKMVESNRENKF